MGKAGEVISHWHLLEDNLQTSTNDFYSAVEKRLRERNLPEISTERVDFKEGGVGSAYRQYLRVRRGRYAFDVCAAPYGTGYFVSWWLVEHIPAFVFWVACALLVMLPVVFVLAIGKLGFGIGLLLFLAITAVVAMMTEMFLNEKALSLRDALSVMPIYGTLYTRYLRPVTYYSLDTAIMFRESVHRSVVEIMDGLRSTQGLRSLSPTEIKVTAPMLERIEPTSGAGATLPS